MTSPIRRNWGDFLPYSAKLPESVRLTEGEKKAMEKERKETEKGNGKEPGGMNALLDSSFFLDGPSDPRPAVFRSAILCIPKSASINAMGLTGWLRRYRLLSPFRCGSFSSQVFDLVAADAEFLPGSLSIAVRIGAVRHLLLLLCERICHPLRPPCDDEDTIEKRGPKTPNFRLQ